jgi:hypothetical protein
MVQPSTLPLELLVLLLSAGCLALSGVLAIYLIEPRDPTPDPKAERFRFRPLARELLLPPVAAVLVATTLLAGVIDLLPLKIGSAHDVDLALLVGAFGGLAVGLFALGVTFLTPRPATERPIGLPSDLRSRRGWAASTSIIAGAGSAALLTLVGLYTLLDGREPAMIAAALGAAVAALAARTTGRVVPTDPGSSSSATLRSAWIRSAASLAVPRALDLYLIVLLAATGASVLAFVPSEIRELQPNAVFFPMAALAAVFVASLLAIPFGIGEDAPTGSFRRVSELGPAAFGFIALLAITPPYLPGGLGLFLSGATGLVGGTAIVLLWSAGRASVAASHGTARIARALVPPIVLAATVALAYWLATLSLGGSIDLSTPSLGLYGVALASVTMVAPFGGFVALDLGGRLAASLNGAGEALDEAQPEVKRLRFTAAVRVGAIAASGLAALVLLSGFVALVPLEAGVAPGVLVASLTGGSEARLLGGVALGLLVPVLTAAVLAYRSPGGFVNPGSADREAIRVRLGRSAGPLLLGVGIPLLGGETLGAVGLVGIGLGALLGTCWHGFSSELLPLGTSEEGPSPTLLPTLALVSLTGLAFGAALYAGLPAGAL